MPYSSLAFVDTNSPQLSSYLSSVQHGNESKFAFALLRQHNAVSSDVLSLSLLQDQVFQGARTGSALKDTQQMPSTGAYCLP